MVLHHRALHTELTSAAVKHLEAQCMSRTISARSTYSPVTVTVTIIIAVIVIAEVTVTAVPLLLSLL